MCINMTFMQKLWLHKCFNRNNADKIKYWEILICTAVIEVIAFRVNTPSNQVMQ